MSTAACELSRLRSAFRSTGEGVETGDAAGGVDPPAEGSGLKFVAGLVAGGDVGGALAATDGGGIGWPEGDGELVSGVSPLPPVESDAGAPVFAGSPVAAKPTFLPESCAAVGSDVTGVFVAGEGGALPGVDEGGTVGAGALTCGVRG